MARRATPDKTIADRIRARRQLLGLSVRHAADRAGLSHSTWSRIENGQNSADNRFTLTAIAEALRCPVGDLTGQPEAPVDTDQAETGGAVYSTMKAVIESDLRYGPTGSAQPLPALAREVELVTELRAKCDYAGAAKRLPDLIRGLHAAAYGPDRADALRGLVVAADTASFVVRYAGHPASSCLVAERAQQAAEALEDPVLLGLAAWAMAHAATGCGLFERAFVVADSAAAQLRPHVGTAADADEMYGSLLMTAAFGAYATGRTAEADARLAEAREIAARTGDSSALKLMFGPTNINFWEISMETDGGDPGRAVEIARQTNPNAVPRVARQAAFYVDTGRALTRIGKEAEAVRMLTTAERVAPQRVRNSPLVVETARALLERAQRNAVGAELRGLCERIGVAG